MLEKLYQLLRKDGTAEAAKKLARFALGELGARLAPRGRELDALLDEIRRGAYERVILRRGSFGWHTPLFQRPQQLSSALAKSGCLVLYEAASPYDRVRGAQKLGENLWLVNLRAFPLRRRLERALEESVTRRYVQVASPESRLRVSSLRAYSRRGWRVIYDYIDALSGEISNSRRVPRRSLELYRYAMRGPCLVLASSLALLRDARRFKPFKDVLLLENGVDSGFFSAPGACPEDERFRELLADGRPVLCYYGALARWLDYAALRALASDGRFQLLLIGVRYDDSYARELAGEENVSFLGPRPYERLRDYAARCDVLLLPFLPGPVGDAASPVKLFEYLAIARPIVAGDVAECRRCDGVLIARSAQDYVRAVEEALALKDSRLFRMRSQSLARQADWQKRADLLCRALRQREE